MLRYQRDLEDCPDVVRFDASSWPGYRGREVEELSGYLSTNPDRSREHFINRYGFAIPSREAVSYLKHFSPLLEVGAGCGYWARELQDAGASVIATDPMTLSEFQTHPTHGFDTPWCDVKGMSAAAAVYNHPQLRSVLSVWPSPDDPWAFGLLDVMSPGTQFFYIGEYRGVCAERHFFDRLERDWRVVHTFPIPRWAGLRDSLWHFVRR